MSHLQQFTHFLSIKCEKKSKEVTNVKHISDFSILWSCYLYNPYVNHT